jgi:3-oxoacyl-[acyl-carrier-protein] synthase-3
MYVPRTVVTNDAFVRMGLDTSEDWIVSRTGIESRHLVAHDESTSEMAVKAGRDALKVSEAHAHDIDLIVLATTTPDHVMPATASLVQERLGATNAGAVDLNAACSGFVYALNMAAAQIESGRARQVLVIGADRLSNHLDWKDRSTCILFGDGAGAVVLKAGEQPGIMSSTMGSDGSGAGLLMIPGDAAPPPAGNGAVPSGGRYLTMNGPQVFRWATQMMTRAAEKVINASGLKPEQVDLFIPHQANIRIIEASARRLGLSFEKVFSNVGRYGNTSAASIPIALCEAIESGLVKVGDNIVFTSFGAGLNWAAVALRWAVDVEARRSRWSPIRMRVEEQVAAVRSAVRRQERRFRASIDERLRGG